MTKVVFNIDSFPKFMEANLNSGTLSFVADLYLNGFKTADKELGYGDYSLSDADYTWFILRFG